MLFRSDVYHKSHCMYSLATLNHPYQLGSDGNVPQFQNRRCQPRANLASMPFSGPQSQTCCLLNGYKCRTPPCGGWQAAISPLNLSHYKESYIKDPSEILLNMSFCLASLSPDFTLYSAPVLLNK